METKLSKSRQKPKRSSLISNLLNRVDGMSLAIKKLPKGGIVYYFENEKVKHLKANKDSLQFMNYEELEKLLKLENLERESLTLEMFKELAWHIPTKVPVEQKPKTFIVRKHDDNNFDKKKDYSNDVNKKTFRKSNSKRDVSDSTEVKKPNTQNNNNKQRRKRI